MARKTSWQRSPSDAVSWHQDQALNTTIYIVHERGPTSFLLKEDNGIKKYKVSLGDPHLCTCSVYEKEKTLCKHICWLLLKKFKLSRQNELSYQLGLVEREINVVLQNPNKSLLPQLRTTDDDILTDDPGDNKKKELKQRPLSEDDACPICQEQLLTKRQPVTFCRHGCGNSVHIKCMKIWADHQRHASTTDKVMCPFCRGEFASPSLLLQEFHNTLHERTDRLDLHLGMICSGCHMNPIKGKCYKCEKCENFFLCNTCYHNKLHHQHKFVFRLKKMQRWRSAPTRGLCDQAALHPIINDLQSREITENDYDILVQLDQPSHLEIPVDLAGLSEHVINRIPMSKVKLGSRLLVPGRQCRLCLQGYSAGELVRRLPECGHIFHRLCIDQWLQNDHRRCPIDRVLVALNKSTASAGSGRENRSEAKTEEKKDEMIVPGVGLIRCQQGCVETGKSKMASTKLRKRIMPAVPHPLASNQGLSLEDHLIQGDGFPKGAFKPFRDPGQNPIEMNSSGSLPIMGQNLTPSASSRVIANRCKKLCLKNSEQATVTDDFASLSLQGTQCPSFISTPSFEKQ